MDSKENILFFMNYDICTLMQKLIFYFFVFCVCKVNIFLEMGKNLKNDFTLLLFLHLSSFCLGSFQDVKFKFDKTSILDIRIEKPPLFLWSVWIVLTLKLPTWQRIETRMMQALKMCILTDRSPYIWCYKIYKHQNTFLI